MTYLEIHITLYCLILILGELKEMIERDFGSVQSMQDQLSATSVAIQGSGWGWLVRQLYGVLYVE